MLGPASWPEQDEWLMNSPPPATAAIKQTNVSKHRTKQNENTQKALGRRKKSNQQTNKLGCNICNSSKKIETNKQTDN